jgi:NifU-like protein involved in Fe-S cluster formation
MSYNNYVIDTFFHSPYLGELKCLWQRTLSVKHGHYGIGDVIEITLGLDSDNLVAECAFKVYGNPYLFAAMTIVCQLFEGRSADEVKPFNREKIIELLELPKTKLHSVLFAEDVYDALKERYKEGQSNE